MGKLNLELSNFRSIICQVVIYVGLERRETFKL